MPLSSNEIAATYPLPAYNYRVDVEGISMSFAQVSGIQIERDTLTYRHGLSYWEGEAIRSYRNNSYIPVTLRKGVVHGNTAIYEWLNADGAERRTVDVHLCDAEGKPVVTWHIAKALAVKLEAPGFDPSDNSVAIESLEIMAAGISLEHH
jgi:phage tail-like protein